MLRIVLETVNDVGIVDNTYDAHGSEVYGSILANIGEELVGALDYTLDETTNVFYIRMINVVKEYRRQGIATQLCNYVKSNYPSYNIDWGYTTTEGEQLRKKLTRNVPNVEYSELKQKITAIQNRLDELENIINTDDDAEFEKLRNSGLIDKYGDEWNCLYDTQREYLDQIQGIEPYKTVWK